MSDPIIDVRDVTKHYDRGQVVALSHTNLAVASGEFVALTGPSGCGKSTLLHLVAALDRPSEGIVLIDGKDVHRRHDHNRYRRHDIGLVFQLHNLIPRLTARENVEIAMFGTHRSRRTRRADATLLLEELGLGAVAGREPPRLSGGERQRIAIARALANDPRILLADEPTGNLDTAAIDTVLGVLAERRRQHGTTIVLVTHDHGVAARADRVVEMRPAAAAAVT